MSAFSDYGYYQHIAIYHSRHRNYSAVLIVRRHIVVGALMFYRDSSSVFFRQQRARWTELNQNRSHTRNECDLKMHVRNLG